MAVTKSRVLINGAANGAMHLEHMPFSVLCYRITHCQLLGPTTIIAPLTIGVFLPFSG